MLRTVMLNGHSAPVFSCDLCHEVITDHRKAIATYPRIDNVGSMDSCFHVHKGECDRRLAERLGKKMPWQELRQHMQYLCHNVGLSVDDLKEDEFDRLTTG